MMRIPIPLSPAEADALDRADPIAHARKHFHIPDGMIYLVGHSLGPASHAALSSLHQTADSDWPNDIVAGWNTAGWIDLARTVGDQLAGLIGAPSGSVLVCDSVSVNLFKLTAAALSRPGLVQQIMIEADEFPTDQYIAEGLSALSDVPLERIAPGTAAEALTRGGVLIKSLVHYRTAELADCAALEAVARAHGAMIVWDLSHATGLIDIQVMRDKVQLATGCTYKYLNGGPGAPAFVYAAPALISGLISPLPGWMGHAAPFAFTPTYEPAEGIARFAAGTPAILSLATLKGALAVFDGVEMSTVAAKAAALCQLCRARAADVSVDFDVVESTTPMGGHVSLRHPEGYAIVQALAAEGIKADFRAPNTMRFGFSPLFLRFRDVWDTMDALAKILDTRAWDDPAFKVRAKVT